MRLTICQETALKELIAWSKTSATSWTLAGAGGTGKSTLMLEAVKQMSGRAGTIVSAPTHKAKLVISQMTGYESSTIQGLIGLSPDMDIENFDINNPIFRPKNEPKIGYYKKVIIDEGSMLPDTLFDYLLTLAQKAGTKLLFLGDKFQIPPVGEHSSKIFDEREVDGISVLSTLVRQSPTSPLPMLLTALRWDIAYHCGWDYSIERNSLQTIMRSFRLTTVIEECDAKIGNIFKFLLSLYPALSNPDTGEGYKLYRDLEIVHQLAVDKFKELIDTKNVSLAKYIAFSNGDVAKANTKFRNALFNNPADTLVKGDFIMAYKTIQKGRDNVLLTNSQEYIIDKITQWNKLDPNSNAVKGYEIDIQQVGSFFTTEGLFVVSPDSYKEFIALHEHYHKLGRDERKWQNYYAFKENYLLLHSLRLMYEKEQLPDGVRTVNNKNLPMKDVDYAYGITTHKSQGSTYDNTFVNLKDISMILRIKDETTTADDKRIFFLKLVYTALSRTKTFANIYS